jgi:hypothetical protein
MDAHLRVARLLRRFLPVLLATLFACRPAPRLAPRPPTLAQNTAGPCCERAPIYDLFAAPYRLGER